MKKDGTLTAWLQLVRPPNLVTVIGDPLAGFLLAFISVPIEGFICIYSVWPCLVASLLIYMSGLLLNDWADSAEDLRDRPERPIPSGKVPARAALAAGLFLMAAGVGIASIAGRLPLSIASCLGILVLVYNAGAKSVRPIGSLVMGLCRAASMVLGSSVLGYASPIVVIAAVGLTFYIMEVTNIAASEVEGKVSRVSRWFPGGVLTVMYICFYYRLGAVRIIPLLLAAAAVLWALSRSVALGRVTTGKEISRQVGLLLRGLLLVQASFCALVGKPGLIAAAGLLLLWPVGIVMSRKFYAS